MKALLIRTGSVPVHLHSFATGTVPVSRSPRAISLQLDPVTSSGIRRAMSHSDVFSMEGTRLGRSVSSGSMVIDGREWPESGVLVEEVGFTGGGTGKGRKTGGSSGGGEYWPAGECGGGSDRTKIGEYYEEMLRSNPSDSLLLGNYAKFLHEVVGDMVKAGEYYGRAILANPSDGEILSLYGKLIWETERDGERAKSYFDRALTASPEDSKVLGLYAHFMWEAEEDEEDNEVMKSEVLATLVEAF